MIEANWREETLAGFSGAKLLWIHRRYHDQRVKGEMRAMLNLAAAMNTAQHGGKALQERLNELRAELTGDKLETGEPISQTPRSQAEFEAMMKATR